MAEGRPERKERWQPPELSLRELWLDFTLTAAFWIVFIYALINGGAGTKHLLGYISKHIVVGVMLGSGLYLFLLNRGGSLRKWLQRRGFISGDKLGWAPLSLRQVRQNHLVLFRGFLIYLLLVGLDESLHLVTLPIPDGVSFLAAGVMFGLVGYLTTYFHTYFDVRAWRELNSATKKWIIRAHKTMGFVHYLTAASYLVSYVLRTDLSAFIAVGFTAVSALLVLSTGAWLFYFFRTHRVERSDRMSRGGESG